MKKINVYIWKILLILYSFINIVILLLNVKNNLINTCICFVIGLIILLVIKKKFNYINKILDNKFLYLALVCIPIILMILLLFINYGNVYSDEATYYNTAVKISKGLMIDNNRYIATFPYLYSYIVMLANIFKILSYKYYVVVLTNIVFNLLGAFTAYKFVCKLFNKSIAKVAYLLWLYNP